MAVKVYPVSLGCPKNRVDTERTLGRPDLKIKPVSRPRGADLVFINTCGFIDPAVRESVQVILQAAEDIAALPEGKRPLLAVAGCLVGRYGQADLAGEMPEVDLWLPTAEMETWPERLLEALKTAGRWQEPKRAPKPPQYPGEGRLLSTGSYAWLKVSEGCGQSCSFCTIPQIRGRLRSQGADFLEREARGLLERGVSELILVAQDLTAWGRDLGEPSGLQKLVERLLPLPGLARLRLMYLYPAGLSEDLLAFLQQAGPPLLPYFDVPLQHADAGILQAMGRPFAGDPFKVVERIRKYFPQAALRTSLITGFPGESERAFARLCDFVRQARFQNLGVFAYQAEEGTVAAALPDQVPVELREERRGVIMEMQAEISRELLEPYLGQDLEVLIDAPHPEWPGLYVGRTWFQAPEVDGVTYVSGEGLEPGQLVKAAVNETFDYDLNALVY